MRRASKRDANEPEIVDALEAMGCGVAKIDSDDGFPDLVVWFKDRHTLIEVKMPGELLTTRQKQFHAAWPGRIHIAHSAGEAIQIVAKL